MLKPVIQNVVSTLSLNIPTCRIDLHAIANRLPNTVYRPERFSALSIRIRRPLRAVALLFATGRLVCVGAKSVDDSRTAISHFQTMIMGDDDDGLATFKVQNIVASAALGQPLLLPGIPILHYPNTLRLHRYLCPAKRGSMAPQHKLQSRDVPGNVPTNEGAELCMSTVFQWKMCHNRGPL
jgi:TATA-box binding protein (TBP) (component of TFIID and TFIIIB)